MERLDLRNPSSQAKCLGTIVAISGAMVVTLYKGPSLITQTPSDASNKLLSAPSNWTLGGLLLAITSLLSSIGNILQANIPHQQNSYPAILRDFVIPNSTFRIAALHTDVILLQRADSASLFLVFQAATAKECPDEVTLVFFYSLFGTVLSAVFSIFLESDPNAWMLHHRIEIIAIIYAVNMYFGTNIIYIYTHYFLLCLQYNRQSCQFLLIVGSVNHCFPQYCNYMVPT